MSRQRSSPVILWFYVAVLAGCASPSPEFMSGSREEVSLGGSRFTIYRHDDAVEVYRISPEVMPRWSEVFAKAEQAIVQVTGCAVVPGSLVGDAALMKAQLDCG